MKPFSFCISLLCSAVLFAQEHFMIIGTYDSPKSEGVYVYKFNSNTGTAKEISHIKTPNPSFITVSPDEKFVYAVHETAPQDGKGGDVAAFSFDKNTGTLTFINKQLSGGDHPCHVEVDKTGSWLFVSNYTGGSLSVLPIKKNGNLGEATVLQHTGSGKNLQRQKNPHVHGAIISADNSKLFVTDLGIDKLVIYDFDVASGKLSSANQQFVQAVAGSGPRLFTFHPNNKYGYMIEELSGTVVVFKNKKGKLLTSQCISTLPAGDTSFAGSADIHVSPDGKFLYASNRGEVNNIAIYSIKKRNGNLRLVGHQPTLGKTPRNFTIDPSGKFLLAENQNSDEIVIFNRDIKTGLLSDTGNRISIGKPVCIKWISTQ
ncbi:MAG: lactonase family protein [Chitinophagaceae bacterium]